MEKKFITHRESGGESYQGQLELSLGPITEASNPNAHETGYSSIQQSTGLRHDQGEIGANGGAGLRYDTGKNRLDLIPPEWEWELARVLTAGAAKYQPRNWELGMAWSKVLGPSRRHQNKFLRGEQIDEETKCHHLALAAWNLLALMSYDLRGLGTDDLARQNFILDR